MSQTDTYEMPVDIPAEKAAAREWLASMMKGATVTYCPTKPQPVPKPWKPRERNSAANDNDEAIPLCEALIRDKRPDDAAMIRRYIHLVDVAGVPEVDSTPAMGEDGVDVARRISFTESGGTIDHGIRVMRNGPISRGNRIGGTSGDIPMSTIAPTRLSGTEDSLIAHIDAKAILGPLRAALGPLLDVFETAALTRANLTQIGTSMGFKGKQASAAAKALVYIAVDTLREAWNRDRRLALVAAGNADRAADKAVAERKAGNILYFGKDIQKRPGTIYGRSKAA